MSEREPTHSEKNAAAGLESIKALVAALECDYKRLEQLKEDAYETNGNYRRSWADAFPEEAAELKELEEAAGDCADEDEALQRIYEDALSVEVRSGWHAIGEEAEDAEYCILLTTGGPALRIIGELRDNEPSSARLEHQDWGTPWTEWITRGADHEALLTYARVFWFGD